MKLIRVKLGVGVGLLLSSFSIMAITVTTIKAKNKVVAFGPVYYATVAAQNESTIAFQADGEITQVLADEGDNVKKGAKMATLDTLTLTLKLKEAQLNEKKAQSNFDLKLKKYQSYLHLSQDNHVGKIELQTQKHELEVAKGNLLKDKVMVKVAENKLSKTSLIAPFDLHIEKRYINKGQLVSIGQKAFEVFQLNPKEVIIHVPEKKLISIKKGRAARISIPSLKWHTTGVVSMVGQKPAFAASYPVEIQFADLTHHKLVSEVKPGMHVEVQIALAKPKNQMEVPLSALVAPKLSSVKSQHSENGLGLASVFIYHPKTSAVSKKIVDVADIKQDRVFIASGLQQGDLVVNSSVNLLKSGMKVTVKKG